MNDRVHTSWLSGNADCFAVGTVFISFSFVSPHTACACAVSLKKSAGDFIMTQHIRLKPNTNLQHTVALLQSMRGWNITHSDINIFREDLLKSFQRVHYLLSVSSLSLCQAQANRGWSTSASTSASPVTSACLSVSITCQSDCVLSTSRPSKTSGKQSCLLAPSIKKRKKNKSQHWLFPLCHTAASKPLKQPTLLVPFHPSEREEMETGCHGYRQSPVVTPLMGKTLWMWHASEITE